MFCAINKTFNIQRLCAKFHPSLMGDKLRSMIKRINEKLDVRILPKPTMIVDTVIVREKYNDLLNLLKGGEIFYSVKTNPHIDILRFLFDLGSGFEIASYQELRDLINLGVPPNRIISGNTLKTGKFIEEAARYGINYFAYDGTEEIDKIAELAPGSRVSLRVAVDNSGSEWPLSKKFGASVSLSLELLQYAINKGLEPIGLTFHVGSQCLNPFAWSNALMMIAEVYYLAKRNNIKIGVINLGGGFPSKLTQDIPHIADIKKNINHTLANIFSNENLKYYIEPGRGVVGEAAITVASIVAKASRESETWLILDVGVYNGLLEAVAGIKYKFISHKEWENSLQKEDMTLYHIGGPSCDSWDTITTDCCLPKDLKVGDIIYILNTGAYTNSVATRFNGFDPPEVYLIH